MSGVIAKEPREYRVSDLMNVHHDKQERKPEQDHAEKPRDHFGEPYCVVMAGIRMVRAGREEVADLVPLFDGYRQFYGQRSDLAAARAFLGDRIERDESVIYLAYTDPDGAAGFTQLYPSFSSVSLKQLWILNDLFVRSDVRRGGVGRALLERARLHAVETGAKGLVLSTGLTNKAAQTLYESCGWQRDDEFFQYHLFF
jgi:GNAT superfamily N-acetyltransferase